MTKAALVRWVSVILPVGILLVGCSAQVQTPSDTSLKITIKLDGKQVEDEYHLNCRNGTASDSSTLPDAAEACALLSSNPDLLSEPTPADQVCTEIYGGPATASVKGDFHGQKIDVAFDRHNGCAIARWDSLIPLLGKSP